MHHYRKHITITILILVLLGTFNTLPLQIPVTASRFGAASPNFADLIPSLAEFSSKVTNGNGHQVVGLYIDKKIAYPVTPQPSNQPGYVSSDSDVLTQFAMASQYGSIGLLAHNYLAGKSFFSLEAGDILILIYGDGHQEYYQIQAINQYQALEPNSPYSSFVDLDSPATTIPVTELFNTIYNAHSRLVLQTCIEANNEPSWGRLFVIAEPIELPGMQLIQNSFEGSALLIGGISLMVHQ